MAALFEARPDADIIQIATVPGRTKSLIEKMTCPVSYKDNNKYLSPYLISLCESERTLDVLLDYVSRNRRSLEKLKSELHSDYKTIKKFYFRNTGEALRKIRLGNKDYLEQRPTKPYFTGQKIITPDLTVYRKHEGVYRRLLAGAAKMPGSLVSSLALRAILRHAEKVQSKEKKRMATGELENTATYFCEMADYLKNFGLSGDFVSQSSLESSSDKNIAHFQFIQGVVLPIFMNTTETAIPLIPRKQKWHLTTLLISIEMQSPRWHKTLNYLQNICAAFTATSGISITPIFRKKDGDILHMYLILKKNRTAAWGIEQSIVEDAPGWLESCGIFIAGSHQAKRFEAVGAQEYYKYYNAPDKYVSRLISDITHKTLAPPLENHRKPRMR